MLISETVTVRWTSNLKKYYVSKGYEFIKMFDYFECCVHDLMPTSTMKVEVKCDYCKEATSLKQYRAYLKEREIINKDCCKNRECMVMKSEESNLLVYGVRNINQTEKRKEEARLMFQTSKDEIIRTAKEKGIEILNIDDYQNDRTRLTIVCQKHKERGEQETNFANIKRLKYCCQYVKSEVESGLPKLDGEIVYNSFLEAGFIPLFNPQDYKNNSQPLPYRCPMHPNEGVQYKSQSALSKAKGCPKCAKEGMVKLQRSEEKEVVKQFYNRGLVLIDPNKYINKDLKMEFYCLEHPQFIQEITLRGLRLTKIPCRYCREEKTVAELNRRMRSSLSKWKKESEIKCNYKCVLTGSDVYEIHHLYSYNSIIIDSLRDLEIKTKAEYTGEEYVLIREEVIKKHEDLLGVCIHPVLHTKFHTYYGKKHNTPEQFDEFKHRYENGEFDEILKERSA